MIHVGDDWAEGHHDVWVMDEGGGRLASLRFPEGVVGVAGFHELVASHVDDPSEVVVGIETDRGLWVEALVAAGYRVYAINPRSVARYRERHSVSGAKSDRGDAKVLADLVRTDRHNHRQVAGDTPGVEAVKVLARAHQNLIWERKRHSNRLRSALREYYPAALEVFPDLKHGDALAVLERAPTPAVATRLSVTQIRAALKRGGRQRYLDQRAADIQEGLRQAHLEAPAGVAAAFGATTSSTVAIITELNRQIAELETTLTADFEEHPDADIYLSMPGMGVVLGGRVLGEFGDLRRPMTDSRFSHFHRLHHEQVLVLANCWDVVTARLVEEAGAPALATTSAAVAWSMGRADGNQLDRELMLGNLRRITEAVEVPVSCDIEGGFGEGDDALAETTRLVIDAGAVGVNIEDSTDEDTLRDRDDAAHRVGVVRAAADEVGADLYINARTDTYLSGSGDFEETVTRAEGYLSAGASGVFVPGLADLETISALTGAIPAPVNILVGPGSPSVPELTEAGVRRVSTGSSLAGAVLGHLSHAAQELFTEGTYTNLENPHTYSDLNDLFA